MVGVKLSEGDERAVCDSCRYNYPRGIHVIYLNSCGRNVATNIVAQAADQERAKLQSGVAE